MFVTDILSQKGSQVFMVDPRTAVAEIARQLSNKCIGALLVRGCAGEILGIVSERDLVRVLARVGAEAVDLEANQVMTDDVTTCDPDDTLDHVMAIMTRRRIRHVPVVRRGELLGMVSIGDVVKARLEEVRHETEVLRAYIVAS